MPNDARELIERLVDAVAAHRGDQASSNPITFDEELEVLTKARDWLAAQEKCGTSQMTQTFIITLTPKSHYENDNLTDELKYCLYEGIGWACQDITIKRVEVRANDFDPSGFKESDS